MKFTIFLDFPISQVVFTLISGVNLDNRPRFRIARDASYTNLWSVVEFGFIKSDQNTKIKCPSLAGHPVNIHENKDICSKNFSVRVSQSKLFFLAL